MPGTRQKDGTARNSESPGGNSEPEKPTDSGEQVDLDGDNDQEESSEEEVEYEEVEVEEEVEEEEEEEEEEEVEEESKPLDEEDEADKKKHAELLALPPHGSEVYIGGIPHETSEKDLRVFCQSVGEVAEVRVMKGKEAKGYAFVTFKTKELASKALKELNNSEFKGRKIKCSPSQVKHRLFIGSVPKEWTVEDMKKVVAKVGPGVISVELLKDPQSSSRNRGFAFIEYHNHACAEYSRQKMSNSNFKLDNNDAIVSWADPRNSESSSSSQVKAVYVKNLPENITQNRLKELFEHHGKITKVALPPAKAGQEKSRYGFVHFADRSSAMKALKNTEKYEINGQTLECSLAKPQADQKSSGASNSFNSAVLPAYPPPLGYGMVGGGYGAVGAGYGAAGFAPPLMYGPGATPAGMTMMPMLLPDGRIAYVLQQPGLQQPSFQQHAPSPVSRHGRSSGVSSSGEKRSNDNSRNRGHCRYNPY